MRVKISNYRDHWISPYTILEKVFFWREIEYDEPVIERWHDCLLPLCVAWNNFWSKVRPRVIDVKIDHWDVWNMDATLGLIVLPMLKKVREQKQGAPFVEDVDVPEHLRSTSAPPKDDECDVDGNHFKRWDWVMDEMIFAFENVLNDHWEEQFYTGVMDMSFQKVEGSSYSRLVEGPNHTHQVDWEGLNAYNDRINNGLRLFGVYYRGLWT